MSEQRVTLQPGDYVKASDIRTHGTYTLVAKAFANAGCEGWPETLKGEADFIGWSIPFNRYGWSTSEPFKMSFKRRLRVSDVLSATNAGNTPAPAPSEIEQALSDPDHPYHDLADVLEQAFRQASGGKGRERHANDLPFNEQRMQTIARGQGHSGGMIYQVCKKAQEAERLPRDDALRELLGVIVYAGGAFIYRKGDE